MKVWIGSLIALILGAGGALGLTAWEFRGVQEEFLRDSGDSPAAVPANASNVDSAQSPVAFVVGEQDFRMGSRERNETIQHTFLVKNEGGGRLQLSLGNLSCSQCVQTEFKQASVGPGETEEIKVTFVTKKPGPEFREGLEITTNDPNKPRIALGGRGVVLMGAVAEPSELTLGGVSASEGGEGEFQITSFRDDDISVVEQTYANPAIAEFFEVTFIKLSPDELKSKPYAKSALKVVVRVKPGLPIGPLNQTIHVKTTTDNGLLVDVPIRGTIVSDISVVGGGGYRFENNVLVLGPVKRSDGAKANLHVMVKGPQRESVTLSVGTVDPPEALRATLGPIRKQGGGAIHIYPLTVEVPQNSPEVNRLGTAENKAGQILIETTHPEAKQVLINVRFRTEE